MSRINAVRLPREHSKVGNLRSFKPDSDLITCGSDDMEAVFSAPLVAFDLLATGSGRDIIEIGAVRYENGAEVGEFSTLVDPGRPLLPEEIEFYGVSPSQLSGAPGLAEAIVALDGFLKGAVLAAHHKSYNAWMLRKAYEKAGGALVNPTIDELPVSRRLFDILRRRYPYPDHLLTDFIAPTAEPYRAMDSARVCGGEFLAALNEAGVKWGLAEIPN